MNFVAHAQVARLLAPSAGDTAAWAFGAALPDLASMAGVRLERTGLPEAVVEGIELHHETDRVFHARAEFREGSRRLTSRLRAAGVEVGPSRAVGHAGWELLLDGCVLQWEGVADGFAAVLDGAPEVAEMLVPTDPARWRSFLRTMAEDRWWLGYEVPDMVARALFRRLQSRRRLAFPAGQTEVVASELAAELPAVRTAAAGLVSAVVDQVSVAAGG